MLSDALQGKNAPVSDRTIIQTIRSVRGNSNCADCDATSMHITLYLNS